MQWSWEEKLGFFQLDARRLATLAATARYFL
jgi:hypothetical protein